MIFFICMDVDTELENCWPLLTSHLDDTGRLPHVNKVLPLQDGPEALLQCDDSPQDFLMEEGLKTLTLRLPQEHLRRTGTFKWSSAVKQDGTPNVKEMNWFPESVPLCCPLDSRQVAGGSVWKTPWCLTWSGSCLEAAAHESDAQSPATGECVCVVIKAV